MQTKKINHIIKKKISRYTSSASNNNSKPKNIVVLSDSILKTLQMKKFNSLLNGRVAHSKFFPGSKAKQLIHHTIPILEEYVQDAAILHVGIKDLRVDKRLRVDKNSTTLVSVCADIINAGLRC